MQGYWERYIKIKKKNDFKLQIDFLFLYDLLVINGLYLSQLFIFYPNKKEEIVMQELVMSCSIHQMQQRSVYSY
jgi:hypothetical protein